MREILFRGKLKQNNRSNRKGDWVYGCFVAMHDGGKKIPHIYGYGEVVPETVGQYTGLTDKNGTKIFEGDILEVQLGCAGTLTEVIEYEGGGFVRNYGERRKPYLQGGRLSEVIGNIHDNPELLKGDAE